LGGVAAYFSLCECALKISAIASSTHSTLTAALDPLLNLFYPQNCCLCGVSVEKHAYGTSCAECWQSAKFFTGQQSVCDKCGAFRSDSPSPLKNLCGKCDNHFYDSARAAGTYEGALRSAVINLKSSPYLPALIRSELLASFDKCSFSGPDLIIPVPLSKMRQIERGYNQAAIIGRMIAAHARMPFDGSSLVRTMHSPMHRAAMDRKAREITVKNAFQVVRPRLISGRTVVLIDDVFTSGATASNCAKVLKKSGADKVYVFTLARAV